MVCVLSERRLNRLTNPALSEGLPAFLTKDPGLFSGMMLSQYTADSLIVEQRILSAPAAIGSIPAAADQEDFVSMGMNTAIKNGQILDNAYGVLGIEYMAAAQALDFRDQDPGRGVAAAKRVIRKHVEHLDVDRPLYSDHTKMKELVRSCEILDAVGLLDIVVGKGIQAAAQPGPHRLAGQYLRPVGVAARAGGAQYRDMEGGVRRSLRLCRWPRLGRPDHGLQQLSRGLWHGPGSRPVSLVRQQLR